MMTPPMKLYRMLPNIPSASNLRWFLLTHRAAVETIPIENHAYTKARKINHQLKPLELALSINMYVSTRLHLSTVRPTIILTPISIGTKRQHFFSKTTQFSNCPKA